jgi:geranylgeranyl diphosphate synthase type I
MPAPADSVVALDRVRADVNTTLDRYIAERQRAARRLHADYGRLWDTMATVLGAGGKRLRPYMLMLSYQGYGGERYEDVLPVAAALELLHNALLMHDDIIDRDTIRHGRPNVTGHYLSLYGPTARHYADSAALVAGDLALSGAYELVLASQLPAEDRLLAQQHLARMMFVVSGGELLDTEAVLGPLADADTDTIIELKCAYYSCVGPLTLGARLAGASEGERARLDQFGLALGSAFQLVDDILGLFGDEAKTGKSTTSDLEEGKRTYLLQQTLAAATSAQRRWLEETIGHGTISAADAARMRNLVTSTGARAKTDALIAAHAATAHDLAGQLAVSEPARAALSDVIHLTVERRH